MNAMPTFNGEGLVPAAAPEDLAVLATVNLSSGSSSVDMLTQRRLARRKRLTQRRLARTGGVLPSAQVPGPRLHAGRR